MRLTASNASITNTVVSSSLTLGNNAVVESLSVGNVSINSSAIAVGNTSITPAAISTPSLILGGTAFSGGLLGGIVDYQEFTANSTWYNPYANATVNSSLTGYEQVFVMAWGGGGGAASNNTTFRNGGGGSCVLGHYTLSSLANTISVTVGLGGTASRVTTTSFGNGGKGGNSVFGSLTAYGGMGDGRDFDGGGGGGWLGQSSGDSAPGGPPLGGLVANPGGVSTFGGGGAALSVGNTGGASIFGGGGAASNSALGGLSIYGGGGGSGMGSTAAGGTSVFGGAGGANGRSGSIPGGGGSANTAAANTGARGEVRVWVIGPGSTTAGEPTYTLTANTTTLYEGSDVLYTVSTTNIANNTTLYYTLNNSSTATSADFTTAVNGSVIITGGTGTFTLTAADDADSANEAFQIDVRTGSESGSIVVSNGSVSVVPYVPTTLGEFYQEGYYVGNIVVGSNTYAVLLAPKATGQSGSTLQLKTTETETAGTTSLVDGLTNSDNMNNATHPAAQYCRGLSIGGYSDWYLPAKDELQLVWTNRLSLVLGERNDNIGIDYWSSSQGTAAVNKGWVTKFADGVQSEEAKDVFLSVRAVRRIQV
jgi:hypothetical protein